MAHLPCSKWRFSQYLNFHQGPFQLLVGYKHHHIPGSQTQKGGHKSEERNNYLVKRTGLGGTDTPTCAVSMLSEGCLSQFFSEIRFGFDVTAEGI